MIYHLTISIESVDDADFCIGMTEAEELLSILENEACKRGYSIYDTSVEEGD